MIGRSGKSSLIGLVFAVAGGILYIIEDVTTSVSSDVISLITQFASLQYPTMKSFIVPVIETLVTLGGIGVILGGVVAYAGSRRYGGYIILLSILGGLLSYGTRLFTAYQAGIFEGTAAEISVFLRGMGLGVVAVVLSVLAYMRLK